MFYLSGNCICLPYLLVFYKWYKTFHNLRKFSLLPKATMILVLIRGSMKHYALMKHYDQKAGGKERIFSAYISTSLISAKGSQDRNSSVAGTWTQELMQKPWLIGLLNLLFSF